MLSAIRSNKKLLNTLRGERSISNDVIIFGGLVLGIKRSARLRMCSPPRWTHTQPRIGSSLHCRIRWGFSSAPECYNGFVHNDDHHPDQYIRHSDNIWPQRCTEDSDRRQHSRCSTRDKLIFCSRLARSKVGLDIPDPLQVQRVVNLCPSTSVGPGSVSSNVAP